MPKGSPRGSRVEIGINPITWTNDDMPELGGDIPLETCLAETREAGYSGTELGGKFPRNSGRAWADPVAARTEAGLRLVRRPDLRTRGGCGIRGDRTASDAAARSRLQGCRLCRYVGPASRRRLSADLATPNAGGCGLAGVRPQGHRACGAHGRRSASAWRSITTWARSCRPMRTSTG